MKDDNKEALVVRIIVGMFVALGAIAGLVAGTGSGKDRRNPPRQHRVRSHFRVVDGGKQSVHGYTRGQQ